MQKPYVGVILYPGCISYEIALAAELLSREYEVINFTPEGRDLIGCSGLALKSQLSFAQFSFENCKAILVPGGDPHTVVENSQLSKILVEANERSLLIGAICAGPVLLAIAGILKAKKIAHGYGSEQLKDLQSLFDGVNLTDELFVADGNLLTAKAEAHIEFAVEIASRLEAVEASRVGKLKEYYRGTLGRKIRTTALAFLENEKGQFLLQKSFDRVKKEVFYRPLGGGVEFHETGQSAVLREIKEELGLETKVGELLSTFENIFTFEGMPSHEIIFLYHAEFKNSSTYQKQEFEVVESGHTIGTAVWRTIDEIREEGAKLYPNPLGQMMRDHLKELS